MENATKALLMASSVLIAVLVIGLLAYGYNQISDIEQTKEDTKQVEVMTDYMRRFEQFNRGKDNPMYGSEIFSLANLQEDYNQTDAREDVGYDKIKINVEIKKSVDNKYFKAGKYDISKVLDDRNTLLEEKSKFEEPEAKYNNKSVKYYSKKSYREIAMDFGINIPSNWGNDLISEELIVNTKTKELMQDIQAYENLNTIYNEFRTGKRFYCESIEYNQYNGRIKEMSLVEI